MKSLTLAKREQARGRAERSIRRRLGEEPARAQFKGYAASRYPLWFSIMVGVMLIVVALSAGFISGVRLYVAGFNQAGDIVSYIGVRVAIGICTFLAAELLVILATVAGQVYLVGDQRWFAAVPIFVGTSVAFVGNWSITDPASMWGWVETFYPPIAVLSVAFFFEISLVPELERIKADTNAFELARSEWQALSDNVELHPKWIGAWATAIREALMQHSGTQVDDLTSDEWRAAVDVEMDAEQWWNSAGIPRTAGTPSAQGRNSAGGLVDSVGGNMSQVDKVRLLLAEYPELADRSLTPVSEAISILGCGNSTFYAAIKQNGRNGSEMSND